jgi:hypothetical protein
MRTHPCVRLFCIINALTITSMLPGVDDSIHDTPIVVARAGHDRIGNMSNHRRTRDTDLTGRED